MRTFSATVTIFLSFCGIAFGDAPHGIQTFTPASQPSGNPPYFARAKTATSLNAQASGAVATINPIFNSNFDSDNGALIAIPATSGWAWGVPTNAGGPQPHSSPNVWAIGLNADYAVTQCDDLDIDLGLGVNSAAAYVEFWAWYYVETGFDGVNFRASTDGGTTWQILHPSDRRYDVATYTGTSNCISGDSAWSGNSNGWVHIAIPIGQFNGQTPMFRLKFGSDASVNYRGFYIDDMTIWDDATPPDGIPNPVTNLRGSVNGSNVTLTWVDPDHDTVGNPLMIDGIEVWLGAAETGTLLATVNPGVQHYTHVKNENGCHYCVRALAGEYYSAAVCLETQDLCDTTGLDRNMALECGTGYGIGQIGGSAPALAVDNDLNSAWYTESTSGRLVMALRTMCSLDSLVLHISTFPNGNARHIVSVSSDSSQWQILRDTTAFWTDGQRLVVPVSSLNSVKYISLYTPISVSYVAWYEVQAIGTPMICQAALATVPSSEDFGTVSCDSSITRSIQINNTSAVRAPILNLFNSNHAFHCSSELIGSWIPPFSSVNLTVQFQPVVEGTFRDTVRIVSRLVGPDTLLIPVTANVPQLPAAPESLVVKRGSGNNINLYWAPVIHSLCGNPITVSQYRIYASTDPSGLFTQIGTSAVDSFVHPFVLNAHAIYFYRVTAWVDSILAPMVLIPAGPYDMGATYRPDAQPVHTVNVPAFHMDINLVTNQQYKAFCDSTSRAYPPDPRSLVPGFYANYFTSATYANYPVVMVDWNDARAYATWSGKRLPTEAEWERAAKGSSDSRQWPWGDSWIASNANVVSNPADGYDYTSPVGAFPNGISPTGCYDMAGNVLEWCEDDYHVDYTGAPADGSAWIDAPRGSFRVIRGGSYAYDNMEARCARRKETGPSNRSDIGFRCAKTP